jgi:hypothetical protein
MGRVTAKLTQEEVEMRCAEAANPTTPPERLASLLTIRLRERFDEVGVLLAANPNCPPEILMQLAPDYPEAFLTNPIVPLLPLERPDCVEMVFGAGRLRLLMYANLPTPFVRTWQQTPNPLIAEAARWHIAVVGEAAPNGGEWHEEIYEVLCDSSPFKPLYPDPMISLLRYLLSLDLAPSFLTRWAERNVRPGQYVRIPTYASAYKAVQRAECIAAWDKLECRVSRFCILATAPLSPAVLHTAADSRRFMERVAAALNPHLPSERRAKLAEDGNRLVRAAARSLRDAEITVTA